MIWKLIGQQDFNILTSSHYKIEPVDESEIEKAYMKRIIGQFGNHCR